MKYKIKDLIGENCITLDDGQKVYDLIHPELLAGYPVEVDFAGVEVFASPFFNAAFGYLLKDLATEDLNRLLKVSNLTPVGREVLQLVIQNSAQYYSDPEFRKTLDEILSEQAEELDGR
jgi:hypothetical protein